MNHLYSTKSCTGTPDALAEGERFERSVGCPTPRFQRGALDRYANPPSGAKITLEKQSEKARYFVCAIDEHLGLVRK